MSTDMRITNYWRRRVRADRVLLCFLRRASSSSRCRCRSMRGCFPLVIGTAGIVLAPDHHVSGTAAATERRPSPLSAPAIRRRNADWRRFATALLAAPAFAHRVLAVRFLHRVVRRDAADAGLDGLCGPQADAAGRCADRGCPGGVLPLSGRREPAPRSGGRLAHRHVAAPTRRSAAANARQSAAGPDGCAAA